MFPFASVHSLAPVASLTASSNSSDGGSSVLFIFLAAIVAIWAISFIGRAGSTVVVVERPVGSFFGFGLIALALGILYFTFIAPNSGLA